MADACKGRPELANNYTRYPCDYDVTQPGDSKGLPVSIDLVTLVESEVPNRQRESILAIEYELGIVPSGTYSTVRARLDALDTLIASLIRRISILEEEGIGSGTIKVRDEGVLVLDKARTLNFKGDAVTVTASGTTAEIVITGGLIMIQVQENFPVLAAGTPQTFNLTYLPDDVTAVLMFVNGIKQDEGTDYTVTGKVVNYVGAALAVTDVVEFWYLAIGSTVQQKQESVIAVGGEVGFTLSVFPQQDDAVQMYVNGLKQEYGTDYIVTGTAVAYSSTPILAGDIIEFWYITGVGGGGGGGGDIEIRQDGVTIVPIAEAIDFVGANWTITNVGGNVARVEVDGYMPVQETLAVTIGGQQDFSLTHIPGDETTVEFFIEGIKQEWGVDYTVSGTTVHYNDTDILVGDVIDVVYQTLGSGSGGGGGGGGCCSLGSALQVGRITAGEDIEVTNGDVIRGQDGFDLVLESTGDGYIRFDKDGYELARFDDLGSSRLLFPAKGFVESTTGDIVLQSGTYTDGYVTYDGYVDVNVQEDLLVRHWRYNGHPIVKFAPGTGSIVQHHFPYGDVYYHGAGITAERGPSNTFQIYTSAGMEIRTDNARDLTIFSDRGVQIWGSTTNKNGGTIIISAGENDGYSGGGNVLISSGGSDFGSSGQVSMLSSAAVGLSGSCLIGSGNSSGNNSGIVTALSGDSTTGSSGAVTIGSGNAPTPGLVTVKGGSSTGTGGAVDVHAGSGGGGGGGQLYLTGGDVSGGGDARLAGASGSIGGDVRVEGGGGATGGDVTISGGSGNTPGDVTIRSLSGSSGGGNITIQCGAGNSPAGDISIYGDVCVDGDGTDINVTGGQGTAGGNLNFASGIGTTGGGGTINIDCADGYTSGGNLNMSAGDGTNAAAGNVNLAAGDGQTYGGNVNIGAGDGTTNVGGNIALATGTGTANGYFNFSFGLLTPVIKITDVAEPEYLGLTGNSDVWMKATIRDGNTFYLGTVSRSGAASTGDLELFTGIANTGISGDIRINTGLGSVTRSGDISINTGGGGPGSGAITIGTGLGTASSGALALSTGNAGGAASSGSIDITTGNAAASNSGSITLTAGSANTPGIPGDIVLDAGEYLGATPGVTDGYIIFKRGGNEVARFDSGGSDRLLLQTQVVEFDGSLGQCKIWQPPSAQDGYDLVLQSQGCGYGYTSGDIVLRSGQVSTPGYAEGFIRIYSGEDEACRFKLNTMTFANDNVGYTISQDARPGTAGNCYIYGQSSTTGNANGFYIRAGNAATDSGSGHGGTLYLRGGDAGTNTVSNFGGFVEIRAGVGAAGTGSAVGGGVGIYAGAGVNGGNGGALDVDAGSSTSGTGGNITINAGTSTSGAGGSLSVTGGHGGTDGGAVNITGGEGDGAAGGDVVISSGVGDTGDGDITCKVGTTPMLVIVTGEVQAEGAVRLKEVADPGTPPTGYWYLWADSSTGKLKVRADTGTTTDLAVS